MKNIFAFMSIFMMFVFAACNKSGAEPDVAKEKRILVGEAKFSNNYSIRLFSNADSLRIGYYPLNAEVLDNNGTKVSTATLQYSLLMKMMTMNHAAPVESPVAYNSTEGLYMGGGGYFTMASNKEEGWTVNVKMTLNGTNYDVAIPVWVAASKTISASVGTKHLAKFTGTDDNVYFLAIVHPDIKEYKVGIQDFEVAVFYKETMMSFPPVNNLKLSFVPTMPSMNSHSSPNNVDPVFTSNGHYKGKVNFTMTGDWRLTFDVVKGSDTIAKNVVLDIYF